MEEVKPILLPAKTKVILEKKLANRESLQAFLNAENQSINELVEAAREMLEVPDGWMLTNTAVGFVAPMDAPEPPSE